MGAPNVLGSSGLPAHGEVEAAAFIDRAMPDELGAGRERFTGKHTLVIGAGHSAANTLLSLAELAGPAPGTRISWAIRTGSAARSYGGDDDALPSACWPPPAGRGPSASSPPPCRSASPRSPTT